jgi:hypothetical protein
MTGFGANREITSRRLRIRRGVSPAALIGIDVQRNAKCCFQLVIIAHFPCLARVSKFYSEGKMRERLLKHEQPQLSPLVWVNALASDLSRGFRGTCPNSGTFLQWNMQLRQVFVAAALGE